MSLADEIGKLTQLRDSGAISEVEFQSAKSKLLTEDPTPGTPMLAGAPQATPKNPKPSLLDPKANAKAAVRILVVLAVLGGGLWLFIRMTVGGRAANSVLATIAQQPIDLDNETENLPASSWKAIPITLPYAGDLKLDVKVVRGNPLDMALVQPAELENIKAERQYQYIVGTDAEKSTNYDRRVRVAAGSYYLVLRDRTLGLFSASTSDVHIKARLEP